MNKIKTHYKDKLGNWIHSGDRLIFRLSEIDSDLFVVGTVQWSSEKKDWYIDLSYFQDGSCLELLSENCDEMEIEN